MRKSWAVAAGVVGALGFMLAQAGPAVAASSGSESWVIVSHGGHPTHVVATGVFNGTGTVVDNVMFDPMAGTFTNTAVQTFKDGSTLTFVDGGTVTLAFDPSNCHADGNLAAPFTITGGTGSLNNASGKGTLSGSLTFIYRHTAAGCDFGGIPLQTLGVAQASGTLNLP